MNTWRGIKVIKKKICLHCHSYFERNKKNTKVFNRQKFCDRKCWSGWFSGNRHHQWKDSKRHECKDCGGNIERHTENRCRICHLKWQKGLNHPSFKHGLYLTGNIEGKRLGKRLSENKRRSLIREIFTKEEWIEVLTEHEYKCAICKVHDKDNKMTIDHIIPISKGGRNIKNNIQPLCSRCNSSKGNRIIIPLVHES